MILGIGVDLVDSRRICDLLERQGEGAIERCMSVQEVAFYQAKPDFALGFAKVFAVKEAVAKALGVGPVWREIELLHKPTGEPYVQLYGQMAERLAARARAASFANGKVHVSITDEPPMVTAFCVLEGE